MPSLAAAQRDTRVQHIDDNRTAGWISQDTNRHPRSESQSRQSPAESMPPEQRNDGGLVALWDRIKRSCQVAQKRTPHLRY